jgi:putative transposase
MKRHRHTPEQVVRKLREGERILNDGKDLSEATMHSQITLHGVHSHAGRHELKGRPQERKAQAELLRRRARVDNASP